MNDNILDKEEWANFDDADVINGVAIATFTGNEWPPECSASTPIRSNDLNSSAANLDRTSSSGFTTTATVFVPPPSTTVTSRKDLPDLYKHPDDPWDISLEQKAYYLIQFAHLQPNPSDRLGGTEAKAYFELSRLPVTELLNIWELADMDRDGALTLCEFCVAMHLVVLRRNGVPVPPSLPVSLLRAASAIASTTTNSKFASSFPTTHRHEVSRTDVGRDQTDSTAAAPGTTHSMLPSRLTPTSIRTRRWSISSQNDIHSLVEKQAHFDGRPNYDSQLSHPTTVRARTLPLPSDVVHRRALSPPPPPPRASLSVQPTASSGNAGVESTCPSLPISSTSIPIDRSSHPPPDRLLSQVQHECDDVIELNEQLTTNLMHLQQQRIALEILLERLMPLDADYHPVVCE